MTSDPHAPFVQKLVIKDWRRAVPRSAGAVFKPFAPSLITDLTVDLSSQPERIDLGVRLGCKHLVALSNALCEIGGNHVALKLKYGQRPAAKVVKGLGKFVATQFPPLS